jgi:osmotically inducible protein OsmC
MALGSGSYEGPYTYKSRFEEGAGTNPEELIGAAHAGCFSMALAMLLSDAGWPPEQVNTDARVHLTAAAGGGFEIARIELVTRVKAPGLDVGTFNRSAEAAKATCPVSKALRAVDIILHASLETPSAPLGA